jgi:hypothetical protein
VDLDVCTAVNNVGQFGTYRGVKIQDIVLAKFSPNFDEEDKEARRGTWE